MNAKDICIYINTLRWNTKETTSKWLGSISVAVSHQTKHPYNNHSNKATHENAVIHYIRRKIWYIHEVWRLVCGFRSYLGHAPSCMQYRHIHPSALACRYIDQSAVASKAGSMTTISPAQTQHLKLHPRIQ